MLPLSRMLFAACLAFPVVASAAETEPPRYNTVSLQAEAQREVPNDLLTATLYVEVNDTTPAAVANAVNRVVNEALRTARDFESVRARSGNNQTHPVYTRGNQLQGWRGRGEVRIESRDFEAASALIGKLQSAMQLGGIQFSVSGDARRAAENELIREAIAAFKARAEIVRSALAGRGYKLQRLNVSTGRTPPRPMYAAAARMSTQQEVAPPQMEGGLSTLTVATNGTIEILE